MHDFKIMEGRGQGWAYAWCPCGWATDVEHHVYERTTDEFRRAFHAHLKTALIDGQDAPISDAGTIEP